MPDSVTVSDFPFSVPVPLEPSLLNVNVTALPLSVYVPASGIDCVDTWPPSAQSASRRHRKQSR